MRRITTHHTNDCNKRIAVHVRENDDDGRFGYVVEILEQDGLTMYAADEFTFQRGPIAEAGVNGITNEVLLAILIDRLEGFQSGKYACTETERALEHCKDALEYLEERTKQREARGVEGTHEV
jgi:hypothetical protein